MTWHRAAAATKTRIKQGANSPPCPTGHGGRHSLCGRRGLQRRVHCLSGFIIGRSSAAHLQHVPQQGKKTLLTDCTRLAVSEIFPLLFVPRPLSLIEPQSHRAKGGCWQQRSVLHSNFLQKKLQFFATAAAAVVVVLFFLCGCMSKWQRGGGAIVCVCVHSAVEHCSVRWLLPQGWGRQAGRETGGGAAVERVPNSK